MFIKEFEVRWSDLDANRHLANSAYINFMSHTRMSFLQDNGFGQREMEQFQIGPVVFHEHVYYFQEVFAGHPIRVGLELGGLSEDGMFFEFIHRFFSHKGTNVCYCEVMGGWINLETRKLASPPLDLLHTLEILKKSQGFKLLTKEDTRKFGKKPQHLL